MASKRIAPTYTYRGGKKMVLTKAADKFVVRAVGEDVAALGARSELQVSSGSTRVKVRPSELEKKMAQSRGIAPTHHAYTVSDTGAEFLITDRVMVRFKPGTAPAEIDKIAAKYALVARERYSPTEVLYQLTDHTGINPVKLVVLLSEKEPLVEMAENDLNQRMQRRSYAQPTDTHYLREWHLHNHFLDPQVDPRASSRCEQAWQLLDGFGSPDVVIAISDDGCRLDHADFSNAKFASWGYFEGTRLVKSMDPDALAAKMYQSGSNHGTSCAGVAAGEVDGVMTVGAAPGCRLLPVKWESDDASLYVSDSKLRSVLDWIADKADVMSNSWGIVPDNLFATMVTDRISQLSTTGGRRGRGIVFLWAAGNEDCPIEFSGTIDIPYDDGWGYDAQGNPRWVGVRKARRFRNTLVGLPGVMHVAALASVARRSHYSNYGTGIDLAAPSSNSHAFWRMTVPGLGIVAPTGEGQRFTLDFGGTSSATPLVAGIAALVISANPLLAAAQVISILRRTASKDVDFTGYGRTPPMAADPNTAWDVSPVPPFANGAFANNGGADGSWSPWFGYGKVDAQAAVAAAIAAAGGPAPAPSPAAGFTASSQASAAIPDNNLAGIEQVLHLGGAGDVGTVRLDVDIAHSFIGDLVVTLVAPDGNAVPVHDRNGGGTMNLKRSWTTADTPGLAALAGSPVAGDWRLRVVDAAAADTGTLKKWSIAVAPRGSTSVALADAAGLAIPDNQPGVVRSLQAATAGTIAEIAVDVDITHSYIGNLRVALVAPDGTRVWLHDRAGGSSDNLIRSWSSANDAALSGLAGKRADGTWKLEVADRAPGHVGKLNRWGLRLAVIPAP
jgi:subtilisin-like proprotein convertase family protein